MDNRKWEADALATAPTAPVTPSSGYPTNGDAGSGQNATEPGAWWFHQIGEELRALIAYAGITPSHTVLTQVRDAILTLTKKRLNANTTFYVSTAGNDGNDGLSALTAFATIQHAWDTLIDSYDLNGYVATIQLANGTYTAGLVARGVPAGAFEIGSVVLNGNATTPSLTTISTTSNNAVTATEKSGFLVQNMKLQTTTSGSGIYASFGAVVKSGVGIVFGPCATAQILAASKGSVFVGSNYSITGGGQYHLFATDDGFISSVAVTVTLTGTPAYSQAFANCTSVSLIAQPGVTFTGGATGPRYFASGLSLINTVGGGANFFPGNAAGSVASGAQYV